MVANLLLCPVPDKDGRHRGRGLAGVRSFQAEIKHLFRINSSLPGFFRPLSAVLDPTGTTYMANPAVSSARVQISTNIPIFVATSARTDSCIDCHTQVSSCGMASNSMTIEKWGTRCNEDDNDDDYHDNNNTPQLCPGAGNARQFVD